MDQLPAGTKISYELLWKAIIRPPKDEYSEIELGEPLFTYNKKDYIRRDYKLLSSRGSIMRCSFLEPIEDNRPSEIMPVIVYCHGNSSCRLEGWRMRKLLMDLNINLFVFDFPACGLSEGEYISLGYHEQNDLKVIIDFVEKIPGVGKIGLWGRSMGAATTLMYTHQDDRIACAIMDSPFADFPRLAEEMARNAIRLPSFIISLALTILNRTVKSKNDMDVNELKPIEHAEFTYKPGLFIHANNDQLINFQHSVDIMEKYAGDKSFVSCEGGHNSCRPKSVLDCIRRFLKRNLVDEHEDINGQSIQSIESIQSVSNDK